jgi:hypothetical protein
MIMNRTIVKESLQHSHIQLILTFKIREEPLTNSCLFIIGFDFLIANASEVFDGVFRFYSLYINLFLSDLFQRFISLFLAMRKFITFI